jgi:hypothetical protein
MDSNSSTLVQINFDAAILDDNFSIQVVVCQGSIIKMVSQISGPSSPVFEEALAAQLAASLAILLHIDRSILEGDSPIFIMALHNPPVIQNFLL